MKKLILLLMVLFVVLSAALSPAVAGGGKVQHENGNETGAGSDAQGNQVNGD